MKAQKTEDKISSILNDPELVRNILEHAIQEALWKHKQAGNPVCGSKDGKVFWVQPENIMLDRNNDY